MRPNPTCSRARSHCALYHRSSLHTRFSLVPLFLKRRCDQTRPARRRRLALLLGLAPRRPQHAPGALAARRPTSEKVLDWPRRCRLARACRWAYIHNLTAEVGPTSGPTWRLSHLVAGCPRLEWVLAEVVVPLCFRDRLKGNGHQCYNHYL
jgi:hypothetical protein